MKALLYFFVLTVLAWGSAPLGGFLFSLFTLTVRLPRVGGLSRFVLAGPLKVAGLLKIAAWTISATGLIYGYYLCEAIVGAPATPTQWIAIALPALVLFSNRVYAVVHLDFVDFRSILKGLRGYLRNFLKEGVDQLDDDDLLTLVRRNFVDMNLIPLLQFLSASAVVLLAADHLGLAGRPLGTSTLSDCLKATFSFSGLTSGEGAPIFSGPVWIVLRFVCGVVLLVWGAVFLAFAMDALPDVDAVREALDIPTREEAQAKFRSEIEAIVAQSAGPNPKVVVNAPTAPESMEPSGEADDLRAPDPR